MVAKNTARAAPAATGHGPQVSDRAGSAISLSPSTPPKPLATASQQRTAYLLAELRCASLRAQLMQADINAIDLALRGSLITLEQAAELLHDCDVLRYIEPTPPTMTP